MAIFHNLTQHSNHAKYLIYLLGCVGRCRLHMIQGHVPFIGVGVQVSPSALFLNEL